MLKPRGAEWILLVVANGQDPNTIPSECFPQEILDANLHLTRIWYDVRALQTKAGASKIRDYDDEMVRLAGDLLEWSTEQHGSLSAVWEREQLRRRRKQATIANGDCPRLIRDRWRGHLGGA